MSFIEPFNSIVTLTKRNHRYYGPTESKKIKGSFSEIATDLITIYNEFDSIETSVVALASGFLMPSSSASGYFVDPDLTSLYDLKRLAYKYEDKLKMQIYTQANQAEVLL